jgi:hypothetical protein
VYIPASAALAKQITRYNPDKTWIRTNDAWAKYAFPGEATALFRRMLRTRNGRTSICGEPAETCCTAVTDSLPPDVARTRRRP